MTSSSCAMSHRPVCFSTEHDLRDTGSLKLMVFPTAASSITLYYFPVFLCPSTTVLFSPHDVIQHLSSQHMTTQRRNYLLVIIIVKSHEISKRIQSLLPVRVMQIFSFGYQKILFQMYSGVLVQSNVCAIFNFRSIVACAKCTFLETGKTLRFSHFSDSLLGKRLCNIIKSIMVCSFTIPVNASFMAVMVVAFLTQHPTSVQSWAAT